MKLRDSNCEIQSRARDATVSPNVSIHVTCKIIITLPNEQPVYSFFLSFFFFPEDCYSSEIRQEAICKLPYGLPQAPNSGQNSQMYHRYVELDSRLKASRTNFLMSHESGFTSADVTRVTASRIRLRIALSRSSSSSSFPYSYRMYIYYTLGGYRQCAQPVAKIRVTGASQGKSRCRARRLFKAR